MNTLAERLRYSMEVLPSKKIKGVELARAVGVKPPSVSDWLSGKSKTMEGENLVRAAKFLNVNATWLATGNGSHQRVDNDIKIAPIEFRSGERKSTNVRIPVYKDIKASCGSGIEHFLEDVSEYLDIDPYILKIMGVQTKPENLRIIYSAEYSMWPTVAPDSPLFVDVSDKDPDHLKNGDVYVFTHNNELRMKRIFVSFSSGKTVRLSSDNPDKTRYPDEFITNEELNSINFVGRLEIALVKP